MDAPKRTHSLYGLETDDIEIAREALERVLEITFEPHESSYLGEYYLFRGNEGEFTLRTNMDPLDGDPAEPAFKERTLLLYVHGLIEGSPRFTSVEHAIATCQPKVELLKRGTY